MSEKKKQVKSPSMFSRPPRLPKEGSGRDTRGEDNLSSDPRTAKKETKCGTEAGLNK